MVSADGQPDERRPDEPGDRIRDRVAGRDDERDQQPDDRGRPKIAEVDQPVAGSMTSESRVSARRTPMAARRARVASSIVLRVRASAALPDGHDGRSALLSPGRMPYRAAATLDGQMSRNGHHEQAIASGVGV